MSIDPQKLIYYIVWLAKTNGVRLTYVRLVKFLYLADYYNSQVKSGDTVTGWPWAFVHFGPYCTEAYETIEKTALDGLIAKNAYESQYGKGEQYYLFDVTEWETPELEEELHIHVSSLLRKAMVKWGNDTAGLLDYVYFDTEPMQNIKPMQRLDFTKPIRPKDIYSSVEMKRIPKRTLKKGKGLIAKLKNKHIAALNEKNEREKNRAKYNLYDEAYEALLRSLNEEDIGTGLEGIVKLNTDKGE